MSRKKGRPRGATNITTVVDVEPSRCVCGSSLRTPYSNHEYDDYAGKGLPFIGIHRRACKCLDCGQARVDREKVYISVENNRESVISSASM